MNVRNPEVKAERPQRRRFTAQYKLRILKEADLCRGHNGAIGQLLRREGLYSSNLAEWRQQRDEGILSVLEKKRGPKPKYSQVELEIQKLRKENIRLSRKLEQAELIIDIQKKIAEILGNPIDPKDLENLGEDKS